MARIDQKFLPDTAGQAQMIKRGGHFLRGNIPGLAEGRMQLVHRGEGMAVALARRRLRMLILMQQVMRLHVRYIGWNRILHGTIHVLPSTDENDGKIEFGQSGDDLMHP